MTPFISSIITLLFHITIAVMGKNMYFIIVYGNSPLSLKIIFFVDFFNTPRGTKTSRLSENFLISILMVSGSAQMFAQRLIPLAHPPVFSSMIIKSEKVR